MLFVSHNNLEESREYMYSAPGVSTPVTFFFTLAWTIHSFIHSVKSSWQNATVHYIIWTGLSKLGNGLTRYIYILSAYTHTGCGVSSLAYHHHHHTGYARLGESS